MGTLTVRIADNTMETFKEKAKEFDSQAEFFTCLMNTYDLALKKSELPEYQANIEAIENSFNDIIKVITGILATRKTIENNIKDTVKNELNSKDVEIERLNKKLISLDDELELVKVQKKEIEKTLKEKTKEMENANKEYSLLQQQFDTFKVVVDEYKEYKPKFDKLSNELELNNTELKNLKNELEKTKVENQKLKEKQQNDIMELKEKHLKEMQEIILSFPTNSKSKETTKPKGTEQIDINTIIESDSQTQKEYLQQFNKNELLHFCKENKIKGNSKLNLSTIIENIVQHFEINKVDKAEQETLEINEINENE